MRTLDLILGALGMTAVGLVLSSVPAVSAAPGELGPPVVEASMLPALDAPFGVETSVDQVERPATPAAHGANRDAIFCCTEGLSPAERAARANSLRRVLAPLGDSERATFERLRLDFLLDREAELTAAEEREIS